MMRYFYFFIFCSSRLAKLYKNLAKDKWYTSNVFKYGIHDIISSFELLLPLFISLPSGIDIIGVLGVSNAMSDAPDIYA